MRPILFVALILSLVALTAPARAQYGFVGALEVTPDRGPVGTRVTLTGSRLPPSATLDIAWETVESDWLLERQGGEFTGIFKGIMIRETQHPIATVTTGADGRFTTALKIPEDHGGVHDIYVLHNGRVLTKTGFRTQPAVTMTPSSGRPGTPIRFKVTGLNPASPLESWYWLLYDNKLTGYVTAVRTGGTARFTIPATGEPGLHVIEFYNGGPGAPYRAPETSPLRQIAGHPSVFRFMFTITEGDVVLPPRIEAQWAKPVAGVEPALASPVIWSDLRSGPVGAKAVLRGKGFNPGDRVELLYYNMKGSRLSSTGFVPYYDDLATVTAGPDGRFEYSYRIPDHLGGDHRIAARVRGAEVTSTNLMVDRTAFPLSAKEYRVGDEILVHFKGIGWTETDNIVAVLYDNSYIGYACGFNSDGDVVVRIRATGTPGWHYIDVYPTLYRYKDYSQTLELPFLFRHAMLSWQDHPQPFVFRYAFKIVK